MTYLHIIIEYHSHVASYEDKAMAWKDFQRIAGRGVQAVYYYESKPTEEQKKQDMKATRDGNSFEGCGKMWCGVCNK